MWYMFIVMSLSQGSATSKQLIHAPFLKCHVSVLTHHSLYNQKCNQHPKFCDRSILPSFMKCVSYWSWSNPEHLKFYTTASWYHLQTSKELSSHAKLTSTLSIQDGKQYNKQHTQDVQIFWVTTVHLYGCWITLICIALMVAWLSWSA